MPTKASRSRPVRRLTRLTAAAGQGLRAARDQGPGGPHPARHLHLRPEGPERRQPATTRRSSSTRARRGAPPPCLARWTSRNRHPGDRHTLRAGPAALPEGRGAGEPGHPDQVGDPPDGHIIADTKEGRADRTVVVGAHLDSVPEGPGINDNGSGTATIPRPPCRYQTRHRADQQDPLRLLGRRGVRPPRLRVLRQTSPIKNSTRLPSTSTSTCSARPTSCASSTTATAPRRPTTPTTPARRARPR